MNIFEWFGRRAAIKKYAKLLGPALAEKYGDKISYEVDEVVNTVRNLHLSEKYIFYAFALYCTKYEYEKIIEYPQSMVIDYAVARSVSLNIALAIGFVNELNSSASVDGSGDFGGDS